MESWATEVSAGLAAARPPGVAEGHTIGARRSRWSSDQAALCSAEHSVTMTVVMSLSRLLYLCFVIQAEEGSRPREWW